MEAIQNNKQRNSVPYQKRQTAVKISIAHLRKGEFVQNKDLLPNYVITQFGHVSRVNIMGILVSKDTTNTSCMIDDKTSIISIQTQFANNSPVSLDNLEIGTSVILIGRPRIFNDDMYIVPEIIAPLQDPLWLQVREKELQLQLNEHFKINSEIKNNNNNNNNNKFQNNEEDSIENTLLEKNKENNDIINKKLERENEVKEEIHDSFEIIQEFIKQNDDGSGVQTNNLLTELVNKNVQEPESMIKKLLEHGEIYEIMPGKIKLL